MLFFSRFFSFSPSLSLLLHSSVQLRCVKFVSLYFVSILFSYRVVKHIHSHISCVYCVQHDEKLHKTVYETVRNCTETSKSYAIFIYMVDAGEFQIHSNNDQLITHLTVVVVVAVVISNGTFERFSKSKHYIYSYH